jgi:hypothetical protein
LEPRESRRFRVYGMAVFSHPLAQDLHNCLNAVFSRNPHQEINLMNTLWHSCGNRLDEFSESECRNDFQHCGHRYI